MKRFLFIAVLFGLCGAIFAAADDDCRDCKCAHCGCMTHCHRVCHVVCEMKEVKKVCYCSKEEDVCIPGRSEKCGEVCQENPCCQVHPADCEACAGNHHAFLDRLLLCHRDREHRTLWEPSCNGRMRGVNKLMKYEVGEKVPTYRWVVEYCCEKCCQQASPDQLHPSADNQAGIDQRSQKQTAGRRESAASGGLLDAVRKLDEPSFLKRLESESPALQNPTTATSPTTVWNRYFGR